MFFLTANYNEATHPELCSHFAVEVYDIMTDELITHYSHSL